MAEGVCGCRAPWRVRSTSLYRGSEPQRGPGVEALVRGTKPPEAESILVIGCQMEPANLAPFEKCLALQAINGLTVDLSALRKTSANN